MQNLQLSSNKIDGDIDSKNYDQNCAIGENSTEVWVIVHLRP